MHSRCGNPRCVQLCLVLARPHKPIADQADHGSRHGRPLPVHPKPMYASLALLYAGLSLWYDVFWALVLLPAVIATVRFYVIAGEERYLERRFGEEYLSYKRRVRRWL